ncbi:hypothetical protein EDE05_11770 [Neorhizobium sp. R1-B]|nr:hypothetical protein EDE05_11770 [Neorhizobium sp. R1-B]
MPSPPIPVTTACPSGALHLITIHPQMLDIMSMSQFLMMLGGIMGPVAEAGAEMRVQWFRYLITRFEPTDIPQAQMVGFMQSCLHSKCRETTC